MRSGIEASKPVKFQTFRTCCDCSERKPISEFYTYGNGASGSYTEKRCKSCKYIRVQQSAKTRGSKSVPTADLAISRMSEFGIFAVPGKYSPFKFIDVVAFGCVLIEIKYSSLLDDKRYMFKFSRRQHQNGISSDLVCLITDDGLSQRFSVFPSDLRVFYHSDGSLKQGVVYQPVGKFRRGDNYLSSELMDSFEDAWQQVYDLVPTWKDRIADIENR